MILNKSTFSNHLDNLQHFISDRGLQTDKTLKFHQKIAEIKASLNNENKLTLQIIGTSSEQIQAFNNLIADHSEIQQLYQLQTNLLPQLPQLNNPNSFPTLILENSSSSTIRYELKSAQTQTIGRNPNLAQILLPDNFGLISGNHAQLQSLPNNKWQIRDSDSMNGTFINGSSEKLQDWHTLEDGDKICLGSDTQELESVTLIFKVPPEDEIHPAYLEAQKLLQCHILCLIVPPQSLSDNSQHFFQLVKKAGINQILIIVDRPGNIDCNSFQITLNKLKELFQNQLLDIPFKIYSLLLNPLTLYPNATIIIPQSQADFESFYNDLIKLSTEKSQTIITEYIVNQFQQILSQIENLLITKQTTLEEKIKEDEEHFKTLSQNNFKKEIDKIYKQIDKERDLFFKQIKTELIQSKAYLMDEFRQQSISTKVINFSQQLQVEISDEKGFRYINLKMPVNENQIQELLPVHHQAINLCHIELEEWVNAQWQKICHQYEDGGLISLWEKTYDALNLIPEIQLLKDKFIVSQNLNIEPIFSISTIDQNFVVKYKQVGFLGYMLKNVKGQIISIGGLLGMISGGAFSKGILIPILLPIVIIILWLSYKQDKENKVEESINKLQKDAANYYQSYVKAVIDRLFQHIEKLLDLEERNLRFTVDEVKEIYTTYFSELDLTQRQLKVQIDEMKRYQLREIEKDITDFHKLKQSIDSI